MTHHEGSNSSMSTSTGSTHEIQQQQQQQLIPSHPPISISIAIGIPHIPFDLFVTKTRNSITFTDAFRNLLYKSSSPHHHQHQHQHMRVLFDASGTSLISLHRSHLNDRASWKALKSNATATANANANANADDILFRVHQTLDTFTKVEFTVILTGGLTFPMRGCCFWRSCTIYHNDHSLIAQTNMMHKLGFRKHFVSRSKFRVTIFPGFADYTFIAALILVFLDGRN